MVNYQLEANKILAHCSHILYERAHRHIYKPVCLSNNIFYLHIYIYSQNIIITTVDRYTHKHVLVMSVFYL